MSKKSKLGVGCLVIFGGVFFIVGLLTFLWQSSAIWKSLGASDWVAVEAKISDVEQTRSYSEGTTTYGVKGTFHYRVNGKRYTSTQLSFYPGHDNIGSYQEDFYRSLSRAKRYNNAKAYYNPDNPSEAVMDKSIRWEMVGFGAVFLVVFGGAGAAIVFAGLWARRKSKKEDLLKQQFADEPWRWREEWQGDYISPNSKAGYIGIGIFAFFWNSIAFPIAIFILPDALSKGEYAALVILLFPLVGTGLMFWAILLFRRHKMFGQTKLYINDNRLKIGLINKGRLTFERVKLENPDAVIRLCSIHKYVTGSGDSRRTEEDVLWEDTQRVKIYSTETSFEFQVPANLKETSSNGKRSEYLWRLEISSVQKGPDLKLEFDIPGFALTEEEKIEIEEQDSDLFNEDSTSKLFNTENRGDWTKIGVVESFGNNGSEYLFPRMNSGLWLPMAFVGFLFVGIGFIPYSMGAGVLFPIIFGFVGGLLGILGLRAVLFKSRVSVVGNSLHYQSGHIAFSKTVTIPRETIKEIEAISMSSSGSTKFYNIVVKTNNHKKHQIAKNLKVKGDVDAFIEKLQRELGLV